MSGDGAEGAGATRGAALDPAASALAIEASRFDAVLAAEAAAYFRDQRRLARIQAEQLHAQRGFALSHLRLRRAADWFATVVRVCLGLAVVGAAFGAVAMLYSAWTSHRVVVEALATPPALVARGVSGTVLALGLRDALLERQDATRGAMGAGGAWAGGVSVAAPAGGVEQRLRRRLGGDLHIGGALVQAADGGLVLTVRAEGLPARSFAGGADDLAALTGAAADYLFGQAQPYRFAMYLVAQGRTAAALAFLPGALAQARDDAARSVLANGFGNALLAAGEPGAAAEKYRLAVLLDPDDWAARANLPAALMLSAGDEAAWQASRAFLLAAAQAPKEPERRMFVAAVFAWDVPLYRDALVAGHADAAMVADAAGLMHDPAATARALAGSDADDAFAQAEALKLRGTAALEAGDAAGAVAPLEAYRAAWLADPELRAFAPDGLCALGLAYGLAGRAAEAASVFGQAGRWAACAAFQGDALAHAGDMAGAAAAWAAGLRAAPDLPLVYLHRGLFALARGQTVAAEADFAAAHDRAPHYADPLKAWGDALAHDGKWADAAGKYSEALTYAPNWAALQRAADLASR